MPYYGVKDFAEAKSATTVFSPDQLVTASASVVFLIGGN